MHNSFITDHFLYFLNIDQARRPEGRSEGLWSAFVDRFSATMGRIRRLHPLWTISTFFAVRLLLFHCTARETDGGTNDRVIDPFAPFEGLVLRHIENDRSSCSIGGLAAFDNGAAQKSPSARPFGHLQGEERIVGVDA